MMSAAEGGPKSDGGIAEIYGILGLNQDIAEKIQDILGAATNQERHDPDSTYIGTAVLDRTDNYYSRYKALENLVRLASDFEDLTIELRGMVGECTIVVADLIRSLTTLNNLTVLLSADRRGDLNTIKTLLTDISAVFSNTTLGVSVTSSINDANPTFAQEFFEGITGICPSGPTWEGIARSNLRSFSKVTFRGNALTNGKDANANKRLNEPKQNYGTNDTAIGAQQTGEH